MSGGYSTHWALASAAVPRIVCVLLRRARARQGGSKQHEELFRRLQHPLGALQAPLAAARQSLGSSASFFGAGGLGRMSVSTRSLSGCDRTHGHLPLALEARQTFGLRSASSSGARARGRVTHFHARSVCTRNLRRCYSIRAQQASGSPASSSACRRHALGGMVNMSTRNLRCHRMMQCSLVTRLVS